MTDLALFREAAQKTETLDLMFMQIVDLLDWHLARVAEGREPQATMALAEARKGLAGLKSIGVLVAVELHRRCQADLAQAEGADA